VDTEAWARTVFLWRLQKWTGAQKKIWERLYKDPSFPQLSCVSSAGWNVFKKGTDILIYIYNWTQTVPHH
jgi:hypothetical protein